MNICKVSVDLTGGDILTIINDFVKVKGLNLEEVDVLNNEILVKGTFSKGIEIKFEGVVSELRVEEGKILGRISKFKVYKLGILKIFRSIALKVALSKVGNIGIDVSKDELKIDLDKILEKVPFVKLSLKEVNIIEDKVNVKAKEISIGIEEIKKLGDNKEVINENEKPILKESEVIEAGEDEVFSLREEALEVREEKLEEEEIEEALKDNTKTKDYYSTGRDVAKEKLKNNLPENAKNFSDYLFLIPDMVALIVRLLKDDRVPIKTKLAVSGSIAYIVCPTDLIPSNIPFIGRIDDLAVLFFALNKIAKDVPLKVIVENWSGKNELIFVLRKGIDYVSNFTGAGNVERIYTVIEELATIYK